MLRSEALQGVRMMRFLDILGRHEAAEFSQLEAAELFRVGERTFRCCRLRFEDEGEAGLLDRRLGKVSGKRVPAEWEAEVEALYRGRYVGFTAKHFGMNVWCSATLSRGATLGRKGFFNRRVARARRAARGASTQAAAPTYAGDAAAPGRLAARTAWGSPRLDLIVTLDDATSAILSAFLVEEEGTDSTFRALAEVFGRHGLPLSLYTDRGSHYFYTPEAGRFYQRDLRSAARLRLAARIFGLNRKEAFVFSFRPAEPASFAAAPFDLKRRAWSVAGTAPA
jgi:hypothetical protein